MSIHEFARREHQRRNALLPGAYRVMDAEGKTVARYIADHRGLMWANVNRCAPIPPAEATTSSGGRFSQIGWVLDLVERGRLELVRIPDDPHNAYAV